METKVMLSNRHIHLCQEDAKLLFGENGATFDHYQEGNSGPFLFRESLVIKGTKGEIKSVKILGPYRKQTQVEVLRSDIYKLGVNPPVALSGDLGEAAELTIVGPSGEITRKCSIIAHRHIHMREDIAKENGLLGTRYVKVRKGGIRGLVFENVAICIGGRGVMMHIDMDEGNAAGISNGDVLEIIVD